MNTTMTTTELPFRATTAQACHWLAQQTGTSWSLARLVGHGLQPTVWIDYATGSSALLGDVKGGYPTAIGFMGDTARLAAAGEDVQITISTGSEDIVTRLRFLKKDLERLASKVGREAPARTPRLTLVRQPGASAG